MTRTPDEEIVQDGWYWVKAKTDYGEPKWAIMQAQIYDYNALKHRDITWWEVMKDWETNHEDILLVGSRIEEPKE
jgi:hypothetical protein